MNQFAPCPKCRQANARQLNFTWWGGVLGPKLLTHVKCESCGKKYNGKTGQDNTLKIILYSVVLSVFFFIIFAVFFAFLFSR